MRNEGGIGNLDWSVVLIYLVLITLGWFNIFAATYDDSAARSIFDLTTNSGKQLLWIGTSLVLIAIILIVDFRIYESLAPILYIIFILMLMAVLVFGKETNGAKAWFELGAFRLQPAELTKFATALLLARFVSSSGVKFSDFKSQVKALAIMFGPVALIMLQPDLGSALIFFSFMLAVFREGFPPVYLLVGLSAAIIGVMTIILPIETIIIVVVAVGIVWVLLTSRSVKNILITLILVASSIGFSFGFGYAFDEVLPEYQRNRILVIFYPDSIDPQNAGFNLNQSKIAIGSGGLTGKGFLEGTQTKGGFVPEQSTDFIFSTLAEEHGWLGSLILITLFMLLLSRILAIAERQKSQFSRVYAYSIAGIIFFHFTINIAMTMGLFPVVGIPLPFFSYGGSSLWSFTIMLFVLLKVDMHRTQILTRN
ncbi:MAG: rod shape-determining protein RodA [Roseivirga sp.]|nr:rod shape-determining protein RodA [Roseivirga sp.]